MELGYSWWYNIFFIRKILFCKILLLLCSHKKKEILFHRIVHKHLVMNWLCKTLCEKLDNPDNIDEITQVGGAATSGATNIKNEQKPKRTTCQLWHNLVQRPRRTFTKKQMEEHNLGIILIAMSSLFIFCQSFKIIPDLYEIIHCNHVGSLGDNCEFAPVSGLPTCLAICTR